MANPYAGTGVTNQMGPNTGYGLGAPVPQYRPPAVRSPATYDANGNLIHPEQPLNSDQLVGQIQQQYPPVAASDQGLQNNLMKFMPGTRQMASVPMLYKQSMKTYGA